MTPPAPHTLAAPPARRTQIRLPLHGLAALRILIVLAIGLGYASTMAIGAESFEWGHHWNYDPSWYGVNLLFILSGFLAARSMTQGRRVRDFIGSRIWSLWPALLAATFISVAVIYPLMCAPDAVNRMSVGDLTLYYVKTVFLIDPGGQMPGLLDDAKYACLLQGAIWTLRWGLVLHIGFLVGWTLKILTGPRRILLLTGLAMGLYIVIAVMAVRNAALMVQVESALPLLRLGYAYLAGIALFAWQHKIPHRFGWTVIIAAGLGVCATLYAQLLPWSPLLEMLGTAFWLTLCLGFLVHAPTVLRRCPRMAPVLYVTIWPAAQIAVAFVPELGQFGTIEASVALASVSAFVMFVLLRQARVQPARL